MKLLSTLLCLVALPAMAATLEGTIVPETLYSDGVTKLPATGPGAITSHRVQYGTCNGSAFGNVLGEQQLAMPAVAFKFTTPTIGLYCLRVYASNVYGEGPAYPVGFSGLSPGSGGSISIVSQKP